MKKISIIFVLFTVLFFGIKSKAVTQQELHDWLLTQNIDISGYGYETTFYNEAVAQYGPNGFAVCYCTGYQNSRYNLNLAAYDKNMYSGMTYSNRTWLYNNSTNYTTMGSQYRCILSNNILMVDTRSNTFTTYCELPSYWQTELQHGNTNFVPPIDWANPKYNPNMPIPEFTTNYGEISVNSSSPEIPFEIEFVNPNSNYYVEVYLNYWIPDNMSISINRTQNNDGFVYKALSRELVNDYLIDPEQMLKISGINNFKLQLQNSWENALDYLPTSTIEYANPNSLPNGMFIQYKNTYENYCRRILGFYGSQFTIMMRYFTIVNNTEYVIGPWRTWTSYSPNEFTERIPDYYVPYVPASGQENITNDVNPENVNVVSGSGTSTGVVADPNYYITVNQNTPNYPDYPTIASYNKDNLLVDTINQMNSLSEFFGQFGDFLTLSFSFFPAWIWAIIGVGFSISIVVMFLKIL